jgi:hypothetical protein
MGTMGTLEIRLHYPLELGNEDASLRSDHPGIASSSIEEMELT